MALTPLIHADFTGSFITLGVFLVGVIHDSVRKYHKRFPRIVLVAIACAFFSPFFRALSNIYSNALMYQLSWFFHVLAPVLLIIWMERALFLRERTFMIFFFSFLGGLSVAFSWLSDAIMSSPVDGSLDWTGTFMIAGNLFLIATYVYALIFFIRVGAKAKASVKIPLIVFICILVFDSFGLPALSQLVPFAGWFFIKGTLDSIAVVMAAYLCLFHPEFLSVITYTLNRLIVINAETGIALYSYTWEKALNEHTELISPLLQALQSMSFEALNMGHLREVHMEEGNLMFKKGQYVIAGIISSRSTMFLEDQLSAFLTLFEIKFADELRNPSIDITKFQSATILVEKLFHAIPLESTRIRWRRKRPEKDYLDPQKDSQLIQDLKDLIAGWESK
nr:hypothetical protein [Candidatus Sigynarchaeota archaeon]